MGASRLRILASLVLGALSSGVRAEQDPGADLSTRFRDEIRPLLQARCAKCQGGEKKKGGIDFSAPLDGPAVLEQRKLWKKTFDQLDVLAMPPQKEPALEGPGGAPRAA